MFMEKKCGVVAATERSKSQFHVPRSIKKNSAKEKLLAISDCN